MIGQPSGPSVASSGSVANPGASAIITSIVAGSLPAGLWHFLIMVSYGAAAGPQNDMVFRRASSNVVIPLLNPVINPANPVYAEVVLSMDGATAVNVIAIAGSGAANYNATIVATPIRG